MGGEEGCFVISGLEDFKKEPLLLLRKLTVSELRVWDRAGLDCWLYEISVKIHKCHGVSSWQGGKFQRKLTVISSFHDSVIWSSPSSFAIRSPKISDSFAFILTGIRSINSLTASKEMRLYGHYQNFRKRVSEFRGREFTSERPTIVSMTLVIFCLLSKLIKFCGVLSGNYFIQTVVDRQKSIFSRETSEKTHVLVLS